MIVDLINAGFEAGAGCIVLRSCGMVWRARAVAGASMMGPIFSATWGIYGLFFYAALDQWWSFGGAVFLTITNLTWFSLMWRHRPAPARPPRSAWLRGMCE